MPVGMKWNELLVNWKNLQICIVNFIKSNKGRQLNNSPFIVTAGDKIQRFQECQDKVNECNHVIPWVYLCGHMLVKISNTLGSSNMMPKNMLTFVKSVTTWVRDLKNFCQIKQS